MNKSLGYKEIPQIGKLLNCSYCSSEQIGIRPKVQVKGLNSRAEVGEVVEWGHGRLTWLLALHISNRQDNRGWL